MTEQQDVQLVSAHYTAGDLGERLLAALQATGKNLDALTLDDLTPIDQFHLGGKSATLRLIARAGFRPGMHLLDIGGGLGGPARTLATEAGCTVTVLDLSEEFCRVGAMLTARTGLTDTVTFQHGSALAMPFADGSFDAVWTQHATMNIADKERLYAEIHRVLRPGGRFAMHDVMAGPNQPIHFPVPWAHDASISFLHSAEAVRASLADTGFHALAWVDEGPIILAALQKQATISTINGPLPLGIQLVIGPQFLTMLENVGRNLQEDRMTIVQAVFERN
ncbi:MAG TPA: methyltransferase domain-containing protein [Thermomicrobiales bacterium]|jgi:SAM-dependent methyltransferase